MKIYAMETKRITYSQAKLLNSELFLIRPKVM